MELLNRNTLRQLEADIGSDMLPMVIGVFLDEVGQQRAQLVPLLQQQSWEALGRLAHSLKSSCGSYGAEVSQQQAARLEQACREGDTPAVIEALVAQLEASLGDVLGELANLRQ